MRRRLLLAIACTLAQGSSSALLAEEPPPDPWTRVEAEVVAGRRDSAAEVARRFQGSDAEALRRYVAAREVTSEDLRRSEAVGEARRLLMSGDPASAKSVAASARASVVNVTEILACLVEAEAEVRSSESPTAHLSAAHAFRQGARTSESIGWRTQAAQMRHWACDHASRAGDYSLAADEADRAYLLWSSIGRGAEAAEALANVAAAATMLRDHRRALDAYAPAIQTFRALGDDRQVAAAESNLGVLYADVGFFARALDAFERSLSAIRHANGDAKLEEAETLDRLGTVRADLGDPKEASRLHEAARKAFLAAATSATEQGDARRVREARLGAALALGNVGVVLGKLESYDSALEQLEKAGKEMAALEDSDGIATVMCNAAEILGRRRQTARAVSLANGAARRWSDLHDDVKATAARGCLGAIYAAANDHPSAIGAWRLAREQADRVEALDLVVEYDIGIGTSLLATKDELGAIEAARSAQRGLAELVTSLGDQEAATARESRVGIPEIGIAAAVRLSNATIAAEFIEGGRGGSLLEAIGSRDALQFAALPRDLAESARSARQMLSAARSKLQAASQAGGGPKIAAPLSRDVAAAEAEIARVEDRVRREAKAAAQVVYPEPAALADVQAILAKDEALVLYARVGAELVALVVTSKTAAIRELGKVADVELACEALQFTRDGSAWAVEVERLSKTIWKPLALPDDVTRVIVSPDGGLGFVPLALVDRTRDIVMAPSGTVLRQLRTADGRKPVDRATGPVLAVGDPDYSVPRPANALSLYGRGTKLLDLPHGGREIAATGTVSLVRKEATEARLREELRKAPGKAPPRGPRPDPGTPRDDGILPWSAVHIACHGILDRERPLLTCLALTPSGDDDGYLTVGEVLNLRVPAELVVLSACETGGGKVFRADGILGLTHAFMAAGAPRVIVSLWKVDDAATAALMVRFYELWRGGGTTAAALRGAQAHVAAQAKWKDPFYWAAWVLWGLPE